MNEEYIEIELEEEPIELCKLLKVLNLVEGGGQAKNLITEGYVGVNHEICTIKRKKLYSGDVLEFDGELFQLSLSEDATPVQKPIEQAPVEPKQNTSAAENQPAKSKRKRTKKPKVDEKTGRRPISFG
ncbi:MULTISPECIES: RNA-binding S4 domain-containing protein [unclassified Pseudoalteromonas]|jgi:ribosome-associated protein|uniref:RNA-binding S4 domain-containing protein n=1 Tax=unclassified Pseudoalteromonas TaxID=194690 RepID=UPI00072FFD5E|nr:MULTISPECIES: RNA-binding S4 domain-containing protein [unclassified Pseudoalteromonas]KTD89072.1 ribosome-associated protein [Pseudoalteromonas sp. H71]MBW4967252.1 RNA-binding S4 domain-containing protein [Pseudoalteromonas sp. CR1]TMN83716.1 RNA-binding S4 domain-containing protein [Pseudoalteromonas sp. S410]TMN91655.1 RNA-binding S4 domain-containing protein [Pseudoalteromonas sp. S408]TMN96064.1 RNA-binding S4 domain-containing protein [Pseudoalteromonas sp. S407]|tara:strand:- start:75 stop:458 length:384 start_codon:yes stop_codon:yes gene_type:complete